MKYKRHKESTTKYNIKAVDGENGTIHGFVRIGVIDGRYQLRGISGIFRADSSGIYFDDQGLFFYGPMRDLRDNFPNSRIPENLKGILERFVDKHYSDKTQDAERIEGDLRFLSMPLEHLELNDRRTVLLEDLCLETKERLPELLSQLERVGVLSNDSNFMKGFGVYFADFPYQLKKEALEKGSFYTLVQRKESKKTETVILPGARVLHKLSLDDMPKWAKDILRENKIKNIGVK